MSTPVTKFDSDPPKSQTFAQQHKLPKLPVPPLEDTCKRYLRALEALQETEDHERTKEVVQNFLKGDGPRIQDALVKWAETKDSYIEDFWYESYLNHTDPVVLALNPFFILENDPTPDRAAQLPRASALITSSLGFIHDLRAGLLQPDSVRGTALDMDQYTRLFGAARIPTERGCRMQVYNDSRHIVVLRRGQFYWFDVLDDENRPVLTERDVLRILRAIVADADKTAIHEVSRSALGVLSTENRKVWSDLRKEIKKDGHNEACLEVMDSALFVVCLDDASPKDLSELCSNFLCGTYELDGGIQIGTCTNRWYDKLQIIVCADGSAGINFEHTGVDGHTVLRFAADVYTDELMLLARSINPSAPQLFHATLSPYAKSFKRKPGQPLPPKLRHPIDTAPKKLEWNLNSVLRVGIQFAETRLSDLICQNDCQALEFKGYGKNFITSHGFSPDAFVQMAFQAAYFGLYGRTECVYEPAMTKAFLHGRTEAIRSVQPESVHFTKTFFSDASAAQKVSALRKACETHTKLTKECSQGLGQDRHLYALYCLIKRQLAGELPGNDQNWPKDNKMPEIFTDKGYEILSRSILSTSNCGNPALRLFGFGPVDRDGFGLGYIIKDDGISVAATSKHLQTRRLLHTLNRYLLEIQQLIIQLHREANETPSPFVDHSGIWRDTKTGRPINGYKSDSESEDEPAMGGYSFFDSGDVALAFNRDKSRYSRVGTVLAISEYY